jgi:hypothetical protein
MEDVMSVRSSRVVAFLFIAACFQGGLTPISACECDTTPPPCRAFWRSDVVFSGRVDTIEYVEAPAPEYSHYRVTFVVDLVLRGPSASQLVIKTASSGASCGFEFREAESYIVYGYNKRGAIWTGRCGRTRPLSQAAEDLEYAAGLTGAGANGFIYGQLRRWDDYPGRSPVTRDLGGMADVPIVVDGPGGPYRTRSRGDGTYQVMALEEGSYRVSLELPDTLMYNGSSDPIRLADAHACERADFNVHFDGRIRGSVQDAMAAPVVGANVVLAASELADDAAGVRYNLGAVTDSDGAFEIKTIPPGRYVLGVNIDPHFENMVILPGKEGRWIWPRVFYPGAPDARNALRIELAAGEKRFLAPLRLPDNLLVRSVSGIARWPDGRPVAEGWVSLLDAHAKLRLSGIVRTTKDGEFQVSAFAGQRVFVQVEARDGERTGYEHSATVEVGSGAAPDPLMVTVKARRY